jgi:ribosome-associated protein
LLDYVNVVVHVFDPERRSYYRLERLWGDADMVQVAEEGSAADVPFLSASAPDA